MNRSTYLAALLSGPILLGACAKSTLAPVVHRAEVEIPKAIVTQRDRAEREALAAPGQDGYHTVASGDTLSLIAWRYQLDYKPLARWNNIGPPYTIYPGQRIRLQPVAGQAGGKTKPAPAQKTAPGARSLAAAKKPPAARKKPAAKPKARPAQAGGRIAWSWPVSGTLVALDSPIARQGLNISGQPRQPIKTAAAGEVVYSGSGLRGYGKLIIIKHSEAYLSAYAHNSKLLVNEGDQVRPGQTISRMGQDATGRYLLHFEIRRHGKPVDPRKYLPAKRAGFQLPIHYVWRQ